MNLRLQTLSYNLTLLFAKKLLVFLLLVVVCPAYSQNPSSNKDLIKQADKYFEDEEYSKAYKLYSQLVSNFPKDPVYNYKLGVCMIYSEPDKKKSLPYLKFAASLAEGNKELKDVLFYLGKAHHINYHFDDAIKNYNDFKLNASSSQIKKLEVDRQIQACANGKHLLSNLTDLEVISKTALPESDYFRSYKKVGGKLLVKPDEFKTSSDKKKKEKSVVFLPNGSNVVYFSSYGDNDGTGKDIYTTYRQADGTYSEAEKVKGVNTEFDEDYPFLHPDGKTLYFASKGFNSMGGYDIFKSIFNEESGTWSSPVNLEFPINSPDDDYLFVTDSLETIAYFSTGRQSMPGKIDVLKVKTKRRPIDIIAMKGNVIQGDPEYSLKSSIIVKDLFNQNELGEFESKEDGSYTMELPNGSKLLFTVKTPGLETQSAQVTIPLASAAKPYRQTISYEKGKLKILNYFNELENDNSYLQYLNVIEKKAKLEVNGSESESDSTTPLAVNTTNPGVPKPNEETTSESEPAEPESVDSASTENSPLDKGMDNAELAKIAKQDAEELLQEAAQLKTDYKTINETGTNQKAEAEKKLEEAEKALSAAELKEDETERKVAIETATDLKKTAENELTVANRVLSVAASLKEDAARKEKEAKLNSEYSKELEKSSKNKGNATSTARLEELQKEINELSSQETASKEAISAIKADVEQKEKQIADIEQSNTAIKSNLEEVKVAIADKETELANTKKKSSKKEISAEIDDLKEEESEKTKQIAANEAEITAIKEDLATAKSELAQVTNIKTEIRPNKTALASEAISAKSLQEKYKGKTILSDPDNLSSIEESNAELLKYNKELDQLINENKSELSKTKNKDLQSRLAADIKQAEVAKKENTNLIASNKKKIESLNKVAVESSAKSEPKTIFNPIIAESEAEALTKLDDLNNQLVFNDTQNFDYNGYQSPAAQNLKIEADAKINDAITKQKILKEEIGKSKKYIEGGSTASAIELNAEAEKIHAEAQKLRTDAKKKKGAEKEEQLTKANTLDESADAKYIEAAEIVRDDNAAMFAANDENIQNLIKENQSSEDDIAKAKELNEEAKEALRKAADIRLEGNSLSSVGAKLGSFSNAEEKEAEALLKQNQALDFLTMSNPTFVLKKATTSTSQSNADDSSDGGNAGDVNSKLETVNAALSDLAAIKIESYQKLNEANATEIAQLQSNLQENQGTIDKTPSIKTDVLSANSKIEKANNLKLGADNATDPNEKINNLIASIKKQNEAIEQLNKIKKSLEGTSPSGGNEVVKQNTTTPKTTRADETTKAKSNDLSMLSEIDIIGAEPEQKVQSDTTTGQILSYFDDNNLYMRNAQAGSTAKTSLKLLKDFEREQSEINAKLQTISNNPASSTSASSVMELNEKAESLIIESEDLALESSKLRNEAQEKSGEEKNELLEKAKTIDNEAQDKTIQASKYKKQANDQEYETSSNAITELLEKLKTENPDLASEIESKRDDYSLLKTQSNNLRQEANALSSKAAKIGALSNVEEKEAELMLKQSAVLSQLQQQYPDYVVKQVTPQSTDQQRVELQQKKSQVQEKQYQELTNLINAFSLEYEFSKNSVSSNLSSDEEDIQQRAEELSSESKRLLIQSSQEKNENEKVKLLTQAAKSGNSAVEELNKLLRDTNRPKSDLDQLGEIENDYVVVNTDVTSEPKAAPKSNTSKKITKVDGLKVVNGNAYSASNPIPIDAPMESGLVFRVQIGAFKTRLADNAFRGLSPLNGETTNSGYIRYTAGNFYAIEGANAVKNDLRNLGYGDAFVVVYFNGRRITMTEALAEMENQGKTIDLNAPKTAGITANSNVPRAAVNSFVQESVSITKELEQMEGLLYTIQIGVFSKQVSKPQILSLNPIFREQLTNGLYRYTAGIYNNPEKLFLDKARVVDMGIRDAFVSAYLNGKRIPFKEAKDLQESGEQVKLEKENPIVFPNGSATNNAPSDLDVLLNTSVNVQPFKNQVNDYPAPTETNGVKTSEQGICYKVQIGAFSKQVPDEVAVKFSSIRTWPVDNKQINGLFIYNIGNFSERRFAADLKDEATRVGIDDAFITVYRDGRKLYGAEAEAYMR